MDKESIILLQKIDSNCNDCSFMQRDFEKYKHSQDLHLKWQTDHFNGSKDRMFKKAEEWKDKSQKSKEAGDEKRAQDEMRKYEQVLREASKMQFKHDKSTTLIIFGKCLKFDKDVSFVPNVCQLDTQECFKHRRDEN